MKVRTYVPAVFSVLLIALLTISASTKNPRLVMGANPGDLAPGIESLEGGGDLVFRNNLKRYTLLNFWAAYDAESRMRNVMFSNEVNKLDSTKIVMYSVSFDESASVFEETLKIDNLDSARQFRGGAGLKSALYKAYKLDRGLKTYLIDDEGRIVSVSFPPGQLAELIKKS